MNKLLSNVKFSNKILLLLVLPILSILYFASVELRRSYTMLSEMNFILEFTKFTVASGTLVHNSATERAMTSLYLSSNGKAFKSEMLQARTKVDAAAKEFKHQSEEMVKIAPRLQQKMATLVNEVDRILEQREKIDRLAIKESDARAAFGKFNGDIIEFVAQEAKATSVARVGSALRGYATISDNKESVGKERALLVQSFTERRISTAEYIQVNKIIEARRTQVIMLNRLAPKEEIEFVEKSRSGAQRAEFDRFEKMVINAGPGGALTANPTAWVTAATNYLETLREAEAESETLLKNIAEEERSSAKTNFIFVLLISAITLLAAAYLTFVISRNITQRLHKTLSDIDTISNGNLTVRATDTGNDELGVIAKAVNHFADKIHDILRALVEASQSIKDSSTKLSETSAILSSGTEQTSTQSKLIADSAEEMNRKMESLSSAIEEMSISIGEISSHGSEASRMAGEANTAVGRSAQTIDELGHAANDIGTVTEMISFIADQTKMLALNASIEAAGAGEAGKGFSVVASEVKELARQTNESTESINAKVQAIQERTANAVTTITQIGQMVTKLRDLNGSIASTVEEQSMVVKEIAANVGTTVEAAKEVGQNISGISAAASEGAREAGNSSEQAKAMLAMSEKLNGIVSAFKV